MTAATGHRRTAKSETPSMPRSILASNIIASTVAGLISTLSILPAMACTALVFKAQDGTAIYGRTMEWGASDLKSELALVPHDTSFKSALGAGKTGMEWKPATASWA